MADMDNEADRPESPLVPSMGDRGEGRVGPDEDPRRGREIPSAPPEGRREDEEEGRRGATSLVDGLLEEAGEKATIGVGGPSCPWSSMCSRFASSVRHILHRMRRLGPPGVAGAESVGVRGNFANMSVSGADPSPFKISSTALSK